MSKVPEEECALQCAPLHHASEAAPRKQCPVCAPQLRRVVQKPKKDPKVVEKVYEDSQGLVYEERVRGWACLVW